MTRRVTDTVTDHGSDAVSAQHPSHPITTNPSFLPTLTRNWGRTLSFARSIPTTIRASGGIINPWLLPNIRAAWLRTGPPPPPIELTEDEWDAFIAALEGRKDS